MEPVIAEYYISIVPIRYIHLAGYHRVAIIFVIMNSAAIFIAVVHLVSPAIIIFELFITFPSDELDYWKEVSYQIRYSVHDEVGGYTIVKMYFHTNMVNSK